MNKDEVENFYEEKTFQDLEAQIWQLHSIKDPMIHGEVVDVILRMFNLIRELTAKPKEKNT